MKRLFTTWLIFLCIITGCGGDKQSVMQDDGIILVDITKRYPDKELILQDFMDVEYIALETNDDFLCQGFVRSITTNYMVVTNRTVNNGDIFIFDRSGKAIKKINRWGQGAEEYTWGLNFVLDEEKDELFVNDYQARKILVYDTDGNFKRSFKHKENAMYVELYEFSSDYLICYDDTMFKEDKEAGDPPFMVISKQDGTVIHETYIPYDRQVSVILEYEVNNAPYFIGPSTFLPLIPHGDNWLFLDASSDTIYSYSPDYTMTPFIARTPSIQSLDPEVFLFLSTFTNRYYFMETVRKEYDLATQTGLPSTDLVYDNQEKALFTYTVYNDDYKIKREVYMKTRSVSKEIAVHQSIPPDHLIESYNNGQLKGKLKEIAATLDEDSNPVIMLVKNKT